MLRSDSSDPSLSSVNSEASNKYDIWLLIIPGTGEDIVKRRQQREQELIEDAERANKIMVSVKGQYDEKRKGIEKIKLMALDETENLLEDLRSIIPALSPILKKIVNKFIQNKANLSADELVAFCETSLAQAEALYHDEIASVRKKNTHNQSHTSADFYMPPVELLRDVKVKVDIAQGVGAETMNPGRMADTGHLTEKPVLARARGLLAGFGEENIIKRWITQLKQAEKNNTLPERIVLNGHSRGGAACIELARAIYLEFGQKVKIAINISDPVPGLGRHGPSNHVVSPNVDSLIINYAANEGALIFDPIDTHHLYFNPMKTVVTTLALPMDHQFAKDGYQAVEALASIRDINNNLWHALTNSKLPNGVEARKIQLNIKTKHNKNDRCGKGWRRNYSMLLASDPALSLNNNLSDFHAHLQTTLYSPLEPNDDIRDSHRVEVDRAVNKLSEETAEQRDAILRAIYNISKGVKEADVPVLENNEQSNEKFLEIRKKISDHNHNIRPTFWSKRQLQTNRCLYYMGMLENVDDPVQIKLITYALLTGKDCTLKNEISAYLGFEKADQAAHAIKYNLGLNEEDFSQIQMHLIAPLITLAEANKDFDYKKLAALKEIYRNFMASWQDTASIKAASQHLKTLFPPVEKVNSNRNDNKHKPLPMAKRKQVPATKRTTVPVTKKQKMPVADTQESASATVEPDMLSPLSSPLDVQAINEKIKKFFVEDGWTEKNIKPTDAKTLELSFIKVIDKCPIQVDVHKAYMDVVGSHVKAFEEVLINFKIKFPGTLPKITLKNSTPENINAWKAALIKNGFNEVEKCLFIGNQSILQQPANNANLPGRGYKP